MRLVLLLAVSLVFGGVVLAAAPSAFACSSDPDAVCVLIDKVECMREGGKPATMLDECWGLP